MIFVDMLCAHRWVLHGKAIMSCHMWTDADDLEELHVFAEQIGLRRAWFQQGSGPLAQEHYDLTEAKRQAAISWGAVPLDKQAAVASWQAIREKKRSRMGVSG